MSRPENELDVDQAALAAEAAAVELPSTQAPPAGDEGIAPGAAPTAIEPPPGSWSDDMPQLMFLVDRFVCPAWHLTDDEKRDLGEPLGQVLDRLFPGGLGSEKWAPYFRLIVVGGAIVVARIDPDTGKLKPLREKKDKPAIEGEPAAAAGPFTTSVDAGP